MGTDQEVQVLRGTWSQGPRANRKARCREATSSVFVEIVKIDGSKERFGPASF